MKNNLEVRGRPEPAKRDNRGRYKKSRVICTHFLKSGKMDKNLWKIDTKFTCDNLSPSIIRGYHFWAIPYVRIMRKSKLAESIMLPLAVSRAEEIAYQMKERTKPNYLGKLVRFVGEPICWVIGQFVSEQNWQSLYVPKQP